MKYFAYGSNMDVMQMEEKGVAFKSVSPGVLADYALVFNKRSRRNPAYGFANIVPLVGSIVEGALYELRDKEMLKLDRSEGYPVHYLRDQVGVMLGGQLVRANVYVANPEMIQEGLMPSRQYLEHLLAGRKFLSEEYFARLKQQVVLDLPEGAFLRKER